MADKKNILYVGLDRETLYLLCAENDFKVAGVGEIESFQVRTFNPANLVFKGVYFFRCQNTFRFFELILLFIWMFVCYFSSSVFKKYSQYLKVISRKKIKVFDLNDPRSIQYIQLSKIDLIVVNAWSILPEKVILAPRFGTVNIHPSKLPQYRGALPTLWSLKNKDRESAVTYILLDKNVDTGKIIRQHVFVLEKDENWFSMEKKITSIIKKTLISDLKRYLDGGLIPSPQDESIKSGTGKYMEYLKIDWENEKFEDIYNKINLYPFLESELYCYFYLGDQRIEMKKAVLSNIVVNMTVGQYVIKGLNVLFQAKDGIIKGKLFVDFSFKNSINLYYKNKK
ncbi:MAG: hypothetical protein A3J06_01065 [Candidatus Moranbacteria bacterium RIFCSPLOWO2_02_FULL_48_19]|nr:MAG: hypothetical protein A3J06_01065 [Candidatus Moranbacteria bacterium RIFCSPLOWO2_02_FULL_48_19]OGI30314.1 MAG: hypothetical protein A3G09_02270 [Candidatus Moranbacteria bacterium RIFCSPLOWO2_12_FULL_48_12]